MYYDTETNDHGLAHDPFKALVAPRPIGWISSLSANGVVNLAPYSYFNAVGSDPYYVMFSSSGRKDSVTNIEATEDFVCSLATYALKDQMNQTSAAVGPDVDEFAFSGLTPAPCRLVEPPRVAESPVAFECRKHTILELPGKDATSVSNWVVIGRVLAIHIDDDVIVEGKVGRHPHAPHRPPRLYGLRRGGRGLRTGTAVLRANAARPAASP